jgi:predicted ATPase
VLEGALLIEQGQVQGGIARIEHAFAEFQHQRAGLGRPWTLALVADGCLRAGMITQGLAATEAAFAAARAHGEAHWEAELHRLKGELLFAQAGADPCEAEAHIREALAVAKRQGARALELRAASSLYRMQMSREAHALLGAVLASFGEGLATRDIVEAARLLSGNCALSA